MITYNTCMFLTLVCSLYVWWIKSLVDPPQKPEKIVEELDLDTRCKVNKPKRLLDAIDY